jgi:Flp pilus assembly pilin Flp
MKNAGSAIKSFCRDESGQDLIEYTLLTAFVVLASAALVINGGGSMTGIWGTANSQLAAGNIAAS